MHIAIVDRRIDPTSLLGRVGGAADGAVVLFLGTVRNHSAGRSVAALEYDAYRTMAERVLREIAEAARRTYGVEAIAIEHRVGPLEIGETSVAVAVSAAHRDSAYRASREIMRRLKREAPIWKREIYLDGEAAWLPGSERSAPEGTAV